VPLVAGRSRQSRHSVLVLVCLLVLVAMVNPPFLGIAVPRWRHPTERESQNTLPRSRQAMGAVVVLVLVRPCVGAGMPMLDTLARSTVGSSVAK